MKHARYIGLMAIALCACRPSMPPQRPANMASETEIKADSDMMALMNINQRLAGEADREINAYIRQDSTHTYAQTDKGAWICRTVKHPEGEHPKMGEEWPVHMLVRTMQGELLQDIEGIMTIGSSQLPLGIEMAIREMYHHEEGIILAPWYAAWGVDGYDNIKPYTNLKIEITTK